MKKILLVLCAFVSGACGASSSCEAASALSSAYEISDWILSRHYALKKYGCVQPKFDKTDELPVVAKAYGFDGPDIAVLERIHQEAERGCLKAQFELARCYYDYFFYMLSPTHYYKWIGLAAYKGHPEAIFLSGVRLIDEGNEKKGISLVGQAVAKGYEPAKSFQAGVYSEGLGVRKKNCKVMGDAEKWLASSRRNEIEEIYFELFCKYRSIRTAKDFGIDLRIIKSTFFHPSQRFEHGLIGICPFSDYFSQSTVETLIRWSNVAFISVTFFIPNGWSKFTLMGRGVEEREAIAQTEEEDSRILNLLLAAFEANGVCRENALKHIVFASDLEQNEMYLLHLRECLERYERDAPFRTACRDISSSIINSTNEQAVDHAVQYILREIPLFWRSAQLFTRRTSFMVYHKITRGFIESNAPGNQGFLKVEVRRR